MTLNHCPDTSLSLLVCHYSGSRDSIILARCYSSGSTGTFFFPAATSPVSSQQCHCRENISRQSERDIETKPEYFAKRYLQMEEMSMPTVTYADRAVEVNDEGFLEHPDEWVKEMAPEIAHDAGVEELTDQHWRVINFMRSEYESKGSGPTVRVLGKTSGVSIKELYQLFPKGPAKLAARIAGIPKPRGCI